MSLTWGASPQLGFKTLLSPGFGLILPVLHLAGAKYHVRAKTTLVVFLEERSNARAAHTPNTPMV